ncbi:MAG: hypothetical protein EAZ61_08605 [Oscillatoriales cyanobacterium]|nr:MAG: hypothetical protein EAZ61_08605 [Oscillatoriales cyanobacterium]
MWQGQTPSTIGLLIPTPRPKTRPKIIRPSSRSTDKLCYVALVSICPSSIQIKRIVILGLSVTTAFQL